MSSGRVRGPERAPLIRSKTVRAKSAYVSKIVKETPTANGATLEITAVAVDNTKVKGTVKLVKEGGAWKWDGEEVM